MTTDVYANPDLWERVTDPWVGKEELWRYCADYMVFSTDGGSTYYSLDKPLDDEGNVTIHNSKENTRAE